MSDNVVPANVDTCLVEFNKKEYAIVGDALFANTVEEVPQWFQNLIQDKVLQVNGPMYDILTQYNLSLLAALQGLDIAKNTYEQYIYKVITDNEAYVASLTTLNSTIAGNDASIRQLLSTYATQDFAVASAAQLLTASLNGGAIGAKIGSVETAMATQYGAMAQRLQQLESSFDDVSGQQEANASAIQKLTTYTGYGVYNGADALIANSNFYNKLNAYLNGTGYSIGGSSTLIQDVTAVSTEKMKQVEAKFQYGSTIEINGRQYNAGFGLVQTGTLLPDRVTYDSEFWINADKFKMTTTGYTGPKYSPFTVDGTNGTITFNGKVSFNSVTGVPDYVLPEEVDAAINNLDVAAAINNNTTTINGSKITTGTIQAGAIAAGAITSDKLSANSVTTNKIAAGAVGSINIASTLQSDNYRSNTSGWVIRKNGTAEFMDVTIAGYGRVGNLSKSTTVAVASGVWVTNSWNDVVSTYAPDPGVARYVTACVTVAANRAEGKYLDLCVRLLFNGVAVVQACAGGSATNTVTVSGGLTGAYAGPVLVQVQVYSYVYNDGITTGGGGFILSTVG